MPQPRSHPTRAIRAAHEADTLAAQVIGADGLTLPVDALAAPHATSAANHRRDDLPPGPPPEPEHRPGDEVAKRYRLVAPIGKGAHGEVWEAHDRLLGETVALKWLHRARGRPDPHTRREIAVLRMLRIPGVVPFLDEGIALGCPFVVMDRVRGAPFPGVSSERGSPLQAPALAARGLALLEVLSRVHAAGVVHLDLKPENVLVDRDGRVTVLDFGISHVTAIGAALSQQGISGTPAYMAPEQARGEAVDHRADLYAVGAMLFEAFSGAPPHDAHQARDLRSLLLARQNSPAERLHCRATGVSERVCAAVDRLLAMRPAERFASASDAIAALRDDPAPRSRRASPPPRAALSEVGLRRLFAGPDRLFHLREDAARVLWEKTSGERDRVDIELSFWEQTGLARRDRGLLVIERSALRRLRDLRPALDPAGLAAMSEQSPMARRALAWLSLCSEPVLPSQLATAMDEAEGALKPACDGLVSRGFARLLGERLEASARCPWPGSDSELRAAHRALAHALEAGAEGRLYHFVSAGEPTAASTEALALGRARAERGDLAGAATALSEGLAARRERPGMAEGVGARLMAELAKVAFAQATPTAHDRTLYELARAGVRTPEATAVEALSRAALASLGHAGLDSAADLVPFSDPSLERWRHRVCVVAAAARTSPAALEAAVSAVQKWHEDSSDPMAALARCESIALLRYTEGRFAEAAKLHLEAAALNPWQASRIAEMLNAASAFLEAFRHRRAARHAAAARRLAAAQRNTYFEGRAEWLLRSARYRAAEALTPDLDLVEALAQVGVPGLAALACLTEAAVAYRCGRLDVAVELSSRAERTWKELDRPAGKLLARSLAIACGAPAKGGEVEAMRAQAIACVVPGIGLQSLGLLGLLAHQPSPAARSASPSRAAALTALAAPIAEAHRPLRMDVLSADEAIEFALHGPRKVRPRAD